MDNKAGAGSSQLGVVDAYGVDERRRVEEDGVAPFAVEGVVAYSTHNGRPCGADNVEIGGVE